MSGLEGGLRGEGALTCPHLRPDHAVEEGRVDGGAAGVVREGRSLAWLNLVELGGRSKVRVRERNFGGE